MSDRGAIVNLYVPSRLSWQQNGRALTLTQSTKYPLDSSVEFTVGTTTRQTFSISLRIPAWAGPSSAITVNDRRWPQSVVAGTFLELRREWRDGDRIALQLERPLRLESVDEQHPDLVAVMAGPLALFALGERFLAVHAPRPAGGTAARGRFERLACNHLRRHAGLQTLLRARLRDDASLSAGVRVTTAAI